jgi:hypothetical protein
MPIGAVKHSTQLSNVENPTTFNNTVITDGISASITAQANTPRGIFFRSDGKRMFILQSATNGPVYQYSLSTAWDLNTLTYDTVSYTPTSGTCEGLFFSADGTRMFLLDRTNALLRSFTLSTAWQISSGVTVGSTLSVSTADASPRSVFFNNLGTRLFIAGNTNSRFGYASLSTPWDISTASAFTVSPTSSQNGEALFITQNGLRAVDFTVGAGTPLVLSAVGGVPYTFNSGTWTSQPTIFYQDLSLTFRDIYVSEDLKYYFAIFGTTIYKLQNPSYSVQTTRMRTAVTATMTLPASILDNDYVILFDSSTNTTQVVPTGFTLLDTVTTAGIRTTISYKKLVAADSSTTITGLSTNTVKTMINFRPSANSNISFSTVNSQATDVAPTQQTITMSGETGTIFGFAYTASTGTSTRTFGGKLPYLNLSPSSTGINANLRGISYQGVDTPSNHTISMTDGGVNTMQSFWVKFTPI